MIPRPRKILAIILATLVFVPGTVLAQDAVERLNPNTATLEELESVSGITPALVEAIAAARPIERTSDFDALVSNQMDDDGKSTIYEVLFLPIDLNEATSEEIAIIPGMTPRMVHEFEEYRPYSDIEQFNREIGKYVDTQEVARLRSFVTLGE